MDVFCVELPGGIQYLKDPAESGKESELVGQLVLLRDGIGEVSEQHFGVVHVAAVLQQMKAHVLGHRLRKTHTTSSPLTTSKVTCQAARTQGARLRLRVADSRQEGVVWPWHPHGVVMSQMAWSCLTGCGHVAERENGHVAGGLSAHHLELLRRALFVLVQQLRKVDVQNRLAQLHATDPISATNCMRACCQIRRGADLCRRQQLWRLIIRHPA
eukprot:1132481-Rhodomonas_salina.3